MNCNYCATELPVGALFCGECGRAVGAVASSFEPDAVRHSAFRWIGTADKSTCFQCGAALSAEDIFCGECGYITRQVADSPGRAGDTVAIDRSELEPLVEPSAPPIAPPVEWASSRPFAQRTPLGGVVRQAEPVPSPGKDDDLEATRIVRRQKSGDRFVLQFSTGESFTVHGTGLVGRNPQPEPGEFFDQLVRVFDPSRSVSKTHLEFGQETGVFWIKDRFSGNGTVAREPDSDGMRCVPDIRVRIERGTRVEIGEQFFIVS